MIKIKSNTNEFTIIFSKKIGKKKNAQKISFSLYSVQHPFFFSPSFLLVSASFLFFLLLFQRPSFRFFLLLFSAPPFFLFLPAFLFFSVHVCPFFQPKDILFSPKTFFSTQTFLPKRFSAQTFQPKCFSVFFSPNVFASIQPLFSSSFFLLYSFLVQASFFSFSASFFSFL